MASWHGLARGCSHSLLYHPFCFLAFSAPSHKTHLPNTSILLPLVWLLFLRGHFLLSIVDCYCFFSVNTSDMLFASKEQAITSSSYFSGNMFSKDSAKEWFLFLSWEAACLTVQGRLLMPAENTLSISSLKSKQETNPQIPKYAFLKLKRSSSLARLLD